MAKVGAKIGMTLKLPGGSQYEFLRPEIYIDDIDTEGDVKKQLKNAVEGLDETWGTVIEQVEGKLKQVMTQVDAQYQLTINRKLQAFEKKIRELEEEIGKKKE
jgi:hypothetical protein